MSRWRYSVVDSGPGPSRMSPQLTMHDGLQATPCRPGQQGREAVHTAPGGAGMATRLVPERPV